MPVREAHWRARLEGVGTERVNEIGSMTKERKAGLLLVIIGVVVPLLLLLITTGYNPDVNVIVNIFNLRLTIHDPIIVPYRFPLAFCIYLIFLGIRKLERPHRNVVKE